MFSPKAFLDNEISARLRKCTAPVSLRNLILVLQSVLDIASALIRISISSFSGISKEVVNGGAAAAAAVGKHYQSQCE